MQSRAAKIQAPSNKPRRHVTLKYMRPTLRKPIQFLKETRAELSKVVWPTRLRAARLTGIVIVITAIFGLFITAVDSGLNKGIQYVIDAQGTGSSGSKNPGGQPGQPGAGQPGQPGSGQPGQPGAGGQAPITVPGGDAPAGAQPAQPGQAPPGPAAPAPAGQAPPAPAPPAPPAQ